MANAPRSGESGEGMISTIRGVLRTCRCRCLPSEVAPLVVTVEYVEKGLNGAGDSVVSDSAEDILLEIVKGKRMCYGWACTVEVVVVVVVVGGVKPDIAGFGARRTRAYMLLTLALTCGLLRLSRAATNL